VQEQLRRVLTTNAVRVIDLFREWDEDGDGIVSKKEFRRAMPLLGLQVGIRVRVRVRVAQGPSPSPRCRCPRTRSTRSSTAGTPTARASSI